MFDARWVDEQHKEKSRYVVKDFANTRDPTMFAAASDTSVGRVVEFKAVIQKLQHVHVRCDVGAHTCLGGRTRHRRRSRNMVIACGGRSERSMGVARLQDRGRSTLIPS